ncbi:MAG: hypothetical protein OEY49_09980, partial [Candidatus Heimdallarchaeota archaeon]|nr:hypothetical protein [Candidatus Heimdallarchaeota archaeon]
ELLFFYNDSNPIFNILKLVHLLLLLMGHFVLRFHLFVRVFDIHYQVNFRYNKCQELNNLFFKLDQKLV